MDLDLEQHINILTVSIGIITLLVAIVTIILGYNLTVFRYKVDKKINKMTSYIELELSNNKKWTIKKLEQYINKSIKYTDLRSDFNDFVDYDIISGLPKINNGLSSLYSSLQKASEINDPFISSSILNQFVHITYVLRAENLKELDNKTLTIFDFDKMLLDVIDRNIKIVESHNMQNLLWDDNGNYLISKECAIKLVKLYHEKALKMS